MKLNRLTPVQNIEIWSPKWSNRTVLIAKFKVGMHNVITFKYAKSLPGEYYISGAKAITYPQQTNGKLMCYCVPLDDLEPLERE